MSNAITNFNLVCCTLGGFITLFGLISYLLKEGFYVTEPLVSLSAGLFLSPHGVHLIRPYEYAGSQEALDTITLCFTRLVLGVQLVIAGVQLPHKYLKREWRSLAILLGPILLGMWIVTSLLVWKLVPGLTFVEGLVVGACVTPTDPVLSNSIVKGKFADKHIPVRLQQLIVAESGANDGLGYLFLLLPLFLVEFLGQDGGAKKAASSWLVGTCLYTVLPGVVFGVVAGWLAREALFWAQKRRLVDKESFRLFIIALALFLIGMVGLIDADDVLACFVAGNVFTWDDWFRQETEEDSLQAVMDLLLNIMVFMWLGAVCPWKSFLSNDIIPTHRLFILGILVLLLRRLPMVFAMRSQIHQIHTNRHAFITGIFGPIGIGATFYLHVTLEFLRDIQASNPEREDCGRLAGATVVTAWFLVVTSLVVHGLSVSAVSLALYAQQAVHMAIRLASKREEPRGSEQAGQISNDPEQRPLLTEQVETA